MVDLITDAFLPVKLLGESLVFQFMAGSLLLKDYIFTFQDNMLFFYQDHDDIDDVLSKPTISDSKFISWINTNKSFPEARNLTYAEFICKFVYAHRKRC